MGSEHVRKKLLILVLTPGDGTVSGTALSVGSSVATESLGANDLLCRRSARFSAARSCS